MPVTHVDQKNPSTLVRSIDDVIFDQVYTSWTKYWDNGAWAAGSGYGTYNYSYKRKYKSYYDGPRNRSSENSAAWTIVRREHANVTFKQKEPGWSSYKIFTGSVEAFQILPSNFIWPSSYAGASQNEAILRLRKKLADAKINSLSSLGELGETVEMVLSTAKSIASAYHNVRRGHFKRAMRDLNLKKVSGAANAWMSYRYGWRPLLQDVENAVVALADRYERADDIIRVEAGREAFSERMFARTGTTQLDTFAASGRKHSYRYVVNARVTGAGTRVLNQLGFVNLPSSGWELLPFSFVVDWFLPIGDYLETLSATAGLTFVSGSCSERNITWWNSGMGSDCFECVIQRSRLTDFPMPSLLPDVKLDLSLAHLTDILSMMKLPKVVDKLYF